MLKSSLSPLYESIKKLLKRTHSVSVRQMSDQLRPNSPFQWIRCLCEKFQDANQPGEFSCLQHYVMTQNIVMPPSYDGAGKGDAVIGIIPDI